MSTPHLRNKANSVAEKVVGEEMKLEDEALAWKMAATNLGVGYVKQGLQLQTQMLGTYTTSQPIVSTKTNLRTQIDHAHKLKAMPVRAMEAELDLGKVTTEQGLILMSQELVRGGTEGSRRVSLSMI
jgi:hypothetical protein